MRRQHHHHHFLPSSSSLVRSTRKSLSALPFLSTMKRSQVSISGDEDPDQQQQHLRPQRQQQTQPTQRTTGEAPVITEIRDNTDELMEANKNFLSFHQKAMADNQLLETPLHPDELIPAYIKMRRSAKLVRFKEEHPDDLVLIDHHMSFPKAPPHPWIEGQPIGDFADIIHGDGQIRRVGTGEIGFDNERRDYPKEWKGLQPRFLTGLKVPETNGVVNQSILVKHSFDRTGRGLFAQKDIKKGETIMIVKSSASSLGYVPQNERLLDMMKEILEKVHASPSRNDDMEFLHTWILQGQQSSLVETWNRDQTDRLIGRLKGGRQVLEDLQLHPLHIARMAAIIDMNSFVVEGYYNEDRGKGYFPEAGYLNHSCCPNADYDIVDEEAFKISDFNDEFVKAREELARKMMNQEGGVGSSTTGASGENNADSEAEQANRKRLGLLNTDYHDTPEAKQRQNQKLRNTIGAEMLLQEAENDGNTSHGHKVKLAYYEDELDAAEDANRDRTSGTYLFCCKAGRDIAAGEEILIAYVPPEWNHDNRQHVLHERYKFWCRCEACAPTIETMSRGFPRIMLGVCVVFMFMNSWIYTLRDNNTKTQQNAFDKEMPFPHTELHGGVPEGHHLPQDHAFAAAPMRIDKTEFGDWPLTAPAVGKEKQKMTKGENYGF